MSKIPADRLLLLICRDAEAEMDRQIAGGAPLADVTVQKREFIRTLKQLARRPALRGVPMQQLPTGHERIWGPPHEGLTVAPTPDAMPLGLVPGWDVT